MIIAAILLGIAANSDNVSVGIGYGIKRRRIRWWHNGVIALITTSITLCALAAGRALRHYLFPDLPSWISGVLLMLLAVWSGYRQPRTEDETFTYNQNDPTLTETLYLSLALSVNNIGLALAGGIGDLGYGAVAVSVCTFSVIMLAAGQLIGGQLVESIGVLRHPMFGNAVLFLAGVVMLAGF
jgi:putative Mn2+ efflux pump MntP